MRKTVLPSVFPWLKTTFKTVTVEVHEKVFLRFDWEGGSNSTYGTHDPNDGRTKNTLPVVEHGHNAFGSVASGYSYLTPGNCIIEDVRFCGKRLGPTVHLHPEDYEKLIGSKELCTLHDECRNNPAMAKDCIKRHSPISDTRTAKILAIFNTIRGGHRKKYFDRAQATKEDFDRVIAAGWVKANKAGVMTLTAEGKVLADTVKIPSYEL